MQKITPFLWFDHQADEAVKFYTSIFKNSKIKHIARYGEAGPGPKGSIMTVEFQLEGQDFVALNGGPHFKFTEAISFVVNCKTQAEVDRYWKKLSAGGKEIQCGWLKDKYGLSWQIVPTILGELMSSKNAAQSQCVMQAMLKMVKLDIKKLTQAARRESADQTPAPAAARKPKTIDEYLAGASADQRAALDELRQTIRAVAPKAEECISYGLAAFRLNGRPLVAFGAWANHCAFYPMSSRTLKAFQNQLKNFVTSKGTIRFSPDNPLPTALVRKLVKARMAENGG